MSGTNRTLTKGYRRGLARLQRQRVGSDAERLSSQDLPTRGSARVLTRSAGWAGQVAIGAAGGR